MSAKIALEMVMYTCTQRQSTRTATIRSLDASDWQSPRCLVSQNDGEPASLAKQYENFCAGMLRCACADGFALLVEDDLIFNRHIEHNLRAWLTSFRPRDVGSLYRTNAGRSVGNQAIVAHAETWKELVVLASQRGDETNGSEPTDAWLRRVVGPRKFRIHSPSLVQHHGHTSTVGHYQHTAQSFALDWFAP